MIVDALPLRRGDTVIDAGCGTGLCFDALQERIGPEGTLVGVDAAPEMLDARRRARRRRRVVQRRAHLRAPGDGRAAHRRPRAVLRGARHHAVRPGPGQRPRPPAARCGRGGGWRQVGAGLGDRHERERARAARAVRARLRGVRPSVDPPRRTRRRPRRAGGRDGRGLRR